MVVRAVDEPALLVPRRDDAAGLVGEEVDGPEQPCGSDPPSASFESPQELGEDLLFVDELGEPEEELALGELRVELRVRVRSRAGDDGLVPHDAQQLDVAESKVRRLSRVKVA